MVAPIVVVIVAAPPPTPELARALVGSCSSVSAAGDCVLPDDPEASRGPRAQVVVSFASNGAAARVEALGGAVRVRDVRFRESDPPEERYRALGLVVAALVAAGDPESGDSTPGAGSPASDAPAGREHPANGRGTVCAAAGILGLAAVRPRAGVWVGTDLSLGPAPLFFRLGVSYEQTWQPDANGLGEQREKIGVGAGLRWPLASPRVWLSVPLEFELEHLVVSVVEPGTGRGDSGSRVLAGLGAGAELAWALDASMGLFVGARAAVLQGSTTVRVQGKVEGEVPAWDASIATGFYVRVP